MRNSIAVAVCLLLGTVLAPSSIEAQGGMGEWFNKLSGPEGKIWLLHWDYCGKKKGLRQETQALISKGSTDKEIRDELVTGYFGCWQEGWSTRIGVGWGFDLNSPSGVGGDLELRILEPMRVWRRDLATYRHPWEPDSYGFGVTIWDFEAPGANLVRYGVIAQATYAIRLNHSEWFFEFGPILRLFNAGFDAEDFAGTSKSDPELNAGAYLGFARSLSLSSRKITREVNRLIRQSRGPLREVPAG